MNYFIDEIFKRVKSPNEKVSANAINDLCCILEIRSWNLSKDARKSKYGTYIAQEILNIDIDEYEEIEIVEFMYNEIIEQNHLLSSLLFAIGQASCKVALKPMINIIEKRFQDFNDNEVYQALISLERILFFDESLSVEEQQKILAKTNILVKVSEKLLSLEPILHSDLESTFARLVARLILLLNGD